MNVLVTGASGLVGGRLVQHLLECGRARIRAASRTARRWPDGVEGCITDIADASTLAAACEGMDAVVHLAAMPERSCAVDPQAALRVNGGGALAWSSAAAGAGVSRFVQVSTYKVYGNQPSGVLTEETPCRPQSHYAITHRVAEDYAASQHPNVVIFRLANGFGVPLAGGVDAWEIIVNDLCRQSVVDRRITIRSSGLSWRNFVPLRHVVQVLRHAALDLPAGLYHLGSAESMTLRDLAERVANLCFETLSFRPPIATAPVKTGEEHAPLEYRIGKLQSIVGMAAGSFDEELRETLLAAQREFVRGSGG